MRYRVGRTSTAAGLQLARTNCLLQIGDHTALTAGATWRFQERSAINLKGVLSLEGGWWTELGYQYRWSDLSSGKVAMRHGLMGTVLTTRIKRGSTVVDVPVVLCTDYRDWKTLLIATLGPVLANLVVSRSAPPLRGREGILFRSARYGTGFKPRLNPTTGPKTASKT